MTRLIESATNIAMVASLLLASGVATADDTPVTTQVVDLANKLAGGPHPGFRAFHAIGIALILGGVWLAGVSNGERRSSRMRLDRPLRGPPVVSAASRRVQISSERGDRGPLPSPAPRGKGNPGT